MMCAEQRTYRTHQRGIFQFTSAKLEPSICGSFRSGSITRGFLATGWIAAAAWIIVEVHDCFILGTTQLLGRRFDPSHRLKEVSSRPRRPTDHIFQYRAKWFEPSMYYLEYMGERPVSTKLPLYGTDQQGIMIGGNMIFVQLTVGSWRRDGLFRGANATFCIDSSGNRLFG
jgi:hypothetical protein